MKCKKIQEILLTDYLDGQLSKNDKLIIENHLSECEKCQKFGDKLADLILEFSDNASFELVPKDLWGKIKNKIVKEKEVKFDFIAKTKFLFPKFLFEAACGFAIVFIVYSFMTVPYKSILQKQVISVGKGNYLLCLDSYLGNESAEESGYGTALEQIFLNTK